MGGQTSASSDPATGVLGIRQQEHLPSAALRALAHRSTRPRRDQFVAFAALGASAEDSDPDLHGLLAQSWFAGGTWFVWLLLFVWHGVCTVCTVCTLFFPPLRENGSSLLRELQGVHAYPDRPGEKGANGANGANGADSWLHVPRRRADHIERLG